MTTPTITTATATKSQPLTKSEVNKRDRIRKRKNAQNYIAAILLHSKCQDCNSTNFLTLQFDHRIPQDKKYEISEMISKGRSPKTIQSEINKCDVVCCNCHQIRTAKHFGSWRLQYLHNQ